MPHTEITSTPHAEKGDEYTAYVVEYEDRAVIKRFSEFYVFDAYLRNRGFVCLPELPNRTLVKLFDTDFIAEGQAALNEYLRRLNHRRDLQLGRLLQLFLEDAEGVYFTSSGANAAGGAAVSQGGNDSRRSSQRQGAPAPPVVVDPFLAGLRYLTFDGLKCVRRFGVVESAAAADRPVLVREVQRALAPQPVSCAVFLPEENTILVATLQADAGSNFFSNLVSALFTPTPKSKSALLLAYCGTILPKASSPSSQVRGLAC